MATLKLYLWRGPGVLLNYGTGLAAVIAASEADAWAVLHRSNLEAFWHLKTGRCLHLYEDGIDAASERAQTAIGLDEEEAGGLSNPELGYPIPPAEHALEGAPVVVMWGSE